MTHLYTFLFYVMFAVIIFRLLLKTPWFSIGRALFKENNFARWILVTIPVIMLSIYLLDAPVRQIFIQLHSVPADSLFSWFNLIGDGAYLYPVLIVYLLISHIFFKPDRIQFAWMLVLSVLLAGLFCQLGKILILRARPYVTDDPFRLFVFIREGFHLSIYNTGNTSFPSGHTANAFALWTPILLKIKNSWTRTILFVLPLMTGLSRIYLNKHWFTDVIVGALLGFWVAFALSKAAKASDNNHLF